MLQVSLQAYVYAFFVIIFSAIIAFILVIRALPGGGFSVVSTRLYHAYYLFGLLGWLILGVKDALRLGIDLTASSFFYITCSFVLLVAVLDRARQKGTLLSVIAAHLLVIGFCIYSPTDMAKLLAMSLYGLVVYPVILLACISRTRKTGNIGNAIIGLACVVIVVGGIVQVYSLLSLNDPEMAYGSILVTSSNAYVLVGIGFLTSIVINERQHLATQALRDPLTGLHNRRGMHYAMTALLAQSARNQSPISAIAIDIDHFKNINDTYGHDGGDAVLTEVGRAMAQCSRGGDISCRIGGEEFVILLPGTDLGMALQVAERVRVHLEKLSIRHGRNHIRITASLGIACHLGAVDLESLLRDADRELYRAKREGRNRICTPVPCAQEA